MYLHEKNFLEGFSLSFTPAGVVLDQILPFLPYFLPAFFFFAEKGGEMGFDISFFFLFFFGPARPKDGARG